MAYSCPRNPRETCLSPAVSAGWSDPVPASTRQPCRRNRIWSRSAAAVEDDGSVDAFPEDGPSTLAWRLVAENVERSSAVGVDCVNVASCVAGFVVLAEFRNCRINGSWTPWGRNKPDIAENLFEKTTRENTPRWSGKKPNTVFIRLTAALEKAPPSIRRLPRISAAPSYDAWLVRVIYSKASSVI